MQSEVLPAELHLVAPPVIPQARSYMFKQKSDLQEFPVVKGTSIKVNIPRLQRSYLTKDSYLRFRVNVDYTVPAATSATIYAPYLSFDRCGAYGLFDRIEVYDYLGGTLLESTQNIPELITLMGDLNIGLGSYEGDLQVTSGYDASKINVAKEGVAGVYDAFELRTSNNGFVFARVSTPPQGSAATTGFVTYEFSIAVPSFLGMFSDKYVPLHNGFTINFVLNDARLAFVSRVSETVSTPNFTLNNVYLNQVEYCCQVMELGEQAELMVMAGSDPAVIPCVQHRYFTDLVLGAGTQSTFRLDMNLNVVSLRTLWWTMRPSVYQDLPYPSYGHRIRNFLERWNFQYGSSYLPEIAGIQARALTVPRSQIGNAYNSLVGADFYKALSNTQAYKELIKTADDWKTSTINLNEFRIDTGAYGGTDAAVGTASDYAFSPIVNAVPSMTSWGDVGVGDKTIIGKFAGGLNTRLSKKAAVSGIDTNGLQVSLNWYFDKDQINNMLQSVLDVWAQHDAFVQVIPGVATTVTF